MKPKDEATALAAAISEHHLRRVYAGTGQGERVFGDLAFFGQFQPLLAKHLKSFSLVDDLGRRRPHAEEFRTDGAAG